MASTMTVDSKPIRLTQFSHGGGCGCKIAPGLLQEILARAPQGIVPPELLVGTETSDDAAVYRLNDSQALVATTDFFTPIVDDPYAYGSIAAANALSDVYAMGGVPLTALAIAGLPKTGLPHETVQAIFLGGFETLRSAGVALLGGHTVQDQEIKFGYAVTGLVDPANVWSNARSLAGDVLILTKPLGTGIVSTAIKHEKASDEVAAAAIAAMRTLNREAAEVLRAQPSATVRACTDITGFGLLGHACEVATASRVVLRIEAGLVPALPGALELAPKFQPGGTANNRAYFSERVRLPDDLDPSLRALLYDPQTSGGLLVSVAPDRARDLVDRLCAAGVPAVRIGEVAASWDGEGAGVEVV